MNVIQIYQGWLNTSGKKAQLRAIVPDSVNVTFQLNQSYEASFTVWDDGSEAFQMVTTQNSVVIDGQPFVIKQVQPDYSGGLTTYSVSAVHYFYEMANSERSYRGTSLRWKNWDGQIVNPDAKDGRTADQVDLTKPDDGKDSDGDTETLTRVSLTDFLEQYAVNQCFGKDHIHIYGSFPDADVNMAQDLALNDVFGLMLTTWPGINIVPDNHEVNLYTADEFFKDRGHRINYLHDTNEITLTYDTTGLSNAARLIGATYELSNGGDLPTVDGAGAEPVNGDWTPVIKLAAYMMDVQISDADINLIKWRIKKESGGNESITQQVWDVNMANGNPAQGLLQYIPTTFQSWMVDGYNNIKKGLDQLLAMFNDSNWRSDIAAPGGWGPTGSKRMSSPAHTKEDQKQQEQGQDSGSGNAQQVIDYAKRNVGLPYVWGGPRGVDQVTGTDCSGLTSNIYKHFGIDIGTVTYTQCQDGSRIDRSQVQTGDLGFYDPGPHHVVMALSNAQAIQQPQPGEVCNVFNIDAYPPSYWIRNPAMAKLVGTGQGNTGDSSSTSDDTNTNTATVSYFTPFFYQNEDSKKLWGMYVQDDITSDTITDEETMRKYADTQLHLNPTFTMDVNTPPGVKIPMGDITRVRIEANEYVASLKMVAFSFYPGAKTAVSTFTYNSQPASILDFYRSQQRALSGVQSKISDWLTISDRSKKIISRLSSGETTDQTKTRPVGGDSN